MKTKQQKKESLGQIKDKLGKAKITIISSFSRSGEKGLKVSEMRDLKKELRGLQAEYVVEKKTLVDKALKLREVKADIFGMQGSLGVAYGYADEFATAKSVYQLSKKYPALKMLAALYEGRMISLEQLIELAKMPSREVLLGRLAGMLMYPLRGLAVALDQVAKKKTN